MLERDLEKVTSLYATIRSLEDKKNMHLELKKHLVAYYYVPKDGNEAVSELCQLSYHLELNADELHEMIADAVIQMLDHKIKECRCVLRKLGVKLDDELPKVPEVKAKKKVKPLLIKGPKNGEEKE